MSDPVAMVIAAVAAPTAANIGVLVTGLLLGIRHGIDWDHIAAITMATGSDIRNGSSGRVERNGRGSILQRLAIEASRKSFRL